MGKQSCIARGGLDAPLRLFQHRRRSGFSLPRVAGAKDCELVRNLSEILTVTMLALCLLSVQCRRLMGGVLSNMACLILLRQIVSSDASIDYGNRSGLWLEFWVSTETRLLESSSYVIYRLGLHGGVIKEGVLVYLGTQGHF